MTITSQATGDIIYASSNSALARLAVGTATQLLHGGTTPSWSALAYADLPAGTVVQMINTPVVASSTATATSAGADNIMTTSDGTEVTAFQTTITPKATTDKLIITLSLNYSDSGQVRCMTGLFQDATVNALASIQTLTSNTGTLMTTGFTFVMAAGTTSATTFKIRIGCISASTITINGEAGSRKGGGIITSSLTVMEVKA